MSIHNAQLDMMRICICLGTNVCMVCPLSATVGCLSHRTAESVSCDTFDTIYTIPLLAYCDTLTASAMFSSTCSLHQRPDPASGLDIIKRTIGLSLAFQLGNAGLV